MPPSAIVRSPGAGRLTPVRVGARFGGEGSAPTLGEGMFVPGRVRIGPLVLGVGLESRGDRALIELAVENVSDEPVRVDSVLVGLRWEEIALEGLRFLRHGWQSWSETGGRALDVAGPAPFPSGEWLRGLHHSRGAPPADRAGWHESDLLSVAGNAAGAACAAGVLERGNEFGNVYLKRESDAVRVEVDWVIETTLAPGARRELDPMRIAVGEDAMQLLQEHADDHGRAAGARTDARFQAGWCSWYHFFHDVTEGDLLRNLEALRNAKQDVPIEVVQLDDGFQRATGDWLETNAKFPRGLEPVAREIREAGFLPGLWTAPFVAVPQSHVFEAHPDWFLGDGDGGFQRGLLHPEWNPVDGAVHTLDLTRDEVVAHVETLFRTLHEMGFVYHKLDFLYAAAMEGAADDPDVTRAERLRRGLDAARRGVGEKDFLLGCGCPQGAAVGVMDGMRIGPDVAPAWGIDAPIVIPGIEATQPSTRSAVRSVLARAFMHRRLWLNDPDCLMARTKDTRLTPSEAATLGAAIGGTGGMLIFSDDWGSLGRDGRELLMDTLELAREVDTLAGGRAVRTLGLLDDFPHGCVVTDGERSIAALVNGGDAPAHRRVDDPSADLELPGHASALVRAGPQPAVAVFCDFDGTFLVEDVGSTLAKRYAADRRPAAWARYEAGELTAWQYNEQILDGLPCPPEDLEQFLMSVSLDPGASSLVDWCTERRVPFRVLSDGFDCNLDRLMERFDVRFDYECNRLWYEDDVWRIAAGFPNPECGCGTGSCKRGRIEAYRRRHPGVPIAHVGNGRVSDLCGADAADWVFAKDSLAEELEQRGMEFVRFDTLADVVAGLEAKISAGQ
ncbi:MAG: alpha-galactosidase [Deltaproteobacteria bacterium]|nr:alpha-galactosidase [Deltaproteobacteria bacterium]MBW2445902.1 alpha-galactosidase [Deltaproteobacteria bacterium]